MDTEWRSQAACADADPEIFFASSGTPVEAAKALCAVCPVADDCLAYAVITAQRFGVWGGSDEDERRLIRRRYVAARRRGAPEPLAVAGV